MLQVHPTLGSDTFLDYTQRRELGKSLKCEHQRISNELSAGHTLKPLIADTPVNCRSTYLLRLNSTGELVAAAHGDRTIGIYSASSGQLYAKCVGHERSPWTLAFHPLHSHLLASGCLGGSIRIWNLESLISLDGTSDVHDVKSTHVWRHSGAIASLAFHSIRPILVVAWTQEVVFYDWVSGRMLSVWRFVSFHSRVRWVKFAPDGNLLYTATANPSHGEVQLNHSKYVHEVGSNSPSKNSVSLTGASTSNFTKKVSDTFISRDLLLEFLIRRSDSWFYNLGVCATCAVRICRWAGTLGPVFPSSAIDIQTGISVARQAAAVAAATLSITNGTLSNLIKELLNFENGRECTDIQERISHDANPAAVAIIEDMPVHEFLLSRGSYCENPKIAVNGNGICCGAHACDLVITHRELMRHSLCRMCLSAFWMWVSKHVSWWRSSHLPNKIINAGIQSNAVKSSEDSSSIFGTFKGNSTLDDSVGLCIQCRAKMSMQYKTNGSDLITQNLSSGEKLPIEECKHTAVERQKHKAHHSMLPLAALDLLRSRLSNAYEVTPITYIASDLIAEGLLTEKIKLLLTLDKKPLYHQLSEVISKFAYEYEISNSPCLKKRRVTTCLSYETPSESSLNGIHSKPVFPIQNNPSSAYSTNVISGHLSHSSHNLCLTQEAIELGVFMRNSNTCKWNYAQPVVIRPPTHRRERTNSIIFPYVSIGSRLLRPSLSEMTLKSNSTDLDVSKTNPTHQISDFDDHHGCDVSEIHNDNLTACCRCGHIVPQTFPVDPHSNLSAVVCERLVLSEGQCSVAAKSFDNNIYNSSSSISSNSSSSSPQHLPEITNLPTPVTNSSQQQVNPIKTTTERFSQGSGNVFYLIDKTSGNSMLNVVNRSITEVITGLFVDMGEYGSANNLQDSTHRICRWELSLCRPVENNDPYQRNSTFEEGKIFNSSYLPMPANVAVSYNSNSLVVSHARLFNDSSICLSPDGRMLAAFVVPRQSSSNLQRKVSLNSTSQDHFTAHETILAVYRLQPKQSRGQCLFARRFIETSPVCLDFSPLGDFLAVGLATTRIPSESYSTIGRSSNDRHLTNPNGSVQHSRLTNTNCGVHCLCENHSSIACIFRLERFLKPNKSVTRSLRNVINIKHPALLNPVSARHYDEMISSVSNLDRWHRLLLSTPNGLSLNTIVWNQNGNILYGTTKGLIVILQGQSPFLAHIPTTNHCTKLATNTLHEREALEKKSHAASSSRNTDNGESQILTEE